jgi:Uma2 family endonuclease
MTTATATPITYGLDASIPRFSVARYQHMIETGALDDNDKMELLENYLVLKMPQNPPHSGTLDLVSGTVGSVLPPGWYQREQKAVVLSDSQPEPDDAVVRGNRRSYLSRHPGPADIGLLIEVANSSLLRDRRDKTRIYARANIVCYWIVNLVDHRVEVYTQPSGPTAVPSYGSFQIYQPGDMVPLVLDGNTVGTVAVNDLLP